jgi:hypothetical protein
MPQPNNPYYLTATASRSLRIGGGVADGVLNVPVPERILNEPRVGAPVGKGEAAGMAERGGGKRRRVGHRLSSPSTRKGELLPLMPSAAPALYACTIGRCNKGKTARAV